MTPIARWFTFIGLVAAGIGVWSLLPDRVSVKPGRARPDVSLARPVTVSDQAVGSDGARAMDASQPPRWEERLNQLANLAGKIPAAELEFELKDFAASLPHEEAMAVLALQLLPGTDEMPLVNQLCVLLFHRWGESNPAEAAAWLSRVPDGVFSRAAHRHLAETWSEASLASAIAWAKALRPGESSAGAQRMVAWKAADRGEPLTAIELLTPLAPDPEREQLLRYSAQQWAVSDRPAAIAWLQRDENAGRREELLSRIAVDWATSDPAAAATFSLTALPAGPHRQQALATSVRYWAVADAQAAAAWVGRVSDEELRAVGAASVAEVWAKDNPSKAAAWLNGLPAGSSRDSAVGMFASTMASAGATDDAARWAATIADPAMRERVQRSLGQP